MRNVSYLGRYIKRPPLSQARMKHYDGGTVAFDYPNHRDGQHRVAEYETEEFIARFIQHIPDKHFRMINFYGFLANRVRGQWLPQIYTLLDQTVEPVRSVRWRDLQTRRFGTDPRLFTLCGCPTRLVGITRGSPPANCVNTASSAACKNVGRFERE
ncbi:transposase [Paraburkholderia sediminicola]|nr:transposase [Paraburkholderia sediminicola]